MKGTVPASDFGQVQRLARVLPVEPDQVFLLGHVALELPAVGARVHGADHEHPVSVDELHVHDHGHELGRRGIDVARGQEQGRGPLAELLGEALLEVPGLEVLLEHHRVPADLAAELELDAELLGGGAFHHLLELGRELAADLGVAEELREVVPDAEVAALLDVRPAEAGALEAGALGLGHGKLDRGAVAELEVDHDFTPNRGGK